MEDTTLPPLHSSDKKYKNVINYVELKFFAHEPLELGVANFTNLFSSPKFHSFNLWEFKLQRDFV